MNDNLPEDVTPQMIGNLCPDEVDCTDQFNDLLNDGTAIAESFQWIEDRANSKEWEAVCKLIKTGASEGMLGQIMLKKCRAYLLNMARQLAEDEAKRMADEAEDDRAMSMAEDRGEWPW